MPTDSDSGGTYRIAYCFADYGVEAEALASIGEVHRFTIDPKPNEFVDETTQVDLMEDTPDAEGFDLWFGHPNCAKYCDMPNVDPDDHEDQIPRARELAESMATEYVIENKPRAPLETPVRLHGRMFGLPLAYERAFETSYEVEQPPIQKTIGGKTVTPYFYPDRTKAWWHTTKGYTGEYPKEHIAKNALPAAYVRFLLRNWLERTNAQDATVPSDNNSPAPKEPHPEQANLPGVQES